MHKSGMIILGICGSRTEGTRSSLPCISVYGLIHHLVPSALVTYLPCPLLRTSTTIFPAFCLRCIPWYMPFLLITFRMYARISWDRRQSLDFSIFAMCIAMHEKSLVRARQPGTTKCRNFLDLYASLRPETRNYLVGLVGDEAQNFELRSLLFIPSCSTLPFVDSVFACTNVFRSNFLDFSQICVMNVSP